MTTAPLRDPGPLPRELTVLRRAAVPAHRLRLSVVVPSYNTAPFVRETLASLCAQTVRDLEIVVVDDGSRDDSVAVLLSIDDPRLTVAVQANRGLAGSRNSGLLLARAPVIGFCDADDLWFARKAEAHLAMLDAEPRVGLTFSYSAYLDERGAFTGQYLLSRCRAPSGRPIRRNHVGNGSTVVARRDAFVRAGPSTKRWAAARTWRCGCVAACSGYDAPSAPGAHRLRVRAGSMSTFDDFIRGYARALERFRHYVPGFTPRAAARSYAECLRIASRKAFSNGQVALSRTLFAEAVRRAPSLPLRDWRAFGMLALHLGAWPLPAAGQQRFYRAVRGAMRAGFRLLPI